jgi:putative transcriptional regulator
MREYYTVFAHCTWRPTAAVQSWSPVQCSNAWAWRPTGGDALAAPAGRPLAEHTALPYAQACAHRCRDADLRQVRERSLVGTRSVPSSSRWRSFRLTCWRRSRRCAAVRCARVTPAVLPAATRARARVGLSQQEFARLLGVSARTLQDWEYGHNAAAHRGAPPYRQAGVVGASGDVLGRASHQGRRWVDPPESANGQGARAPLADNRVDLQTGRPSRGNALKE